ncbi:HEAT repeat domain-containing protein [Candidatus Latescibacterota bacterium]
MTVPILLFSGCSKTNDDYIQDLYSDNAQERMMAAATLMRRGKDSNTVKKLIYILDEDDERAKFISVQILGALADTSAVQPIGMILESGNSVMRAKACWSLGSIGHESGMPFLLKAIKDPYSDVRYAALIAIGHISDVPIVEHVYPMFRDDEDSVRVAAIQALHYNFKSVKDSGILAADFALPLNDTSELVRFVAVQALGAGFPDSTVAADLLLDALDNESKNVRIEAIISLGKIRSQKAIPVLKQIYDITSVDEEFVITQAIKETTGEDFPPIEENVE